MKRNRQNLRQRRAFARRRPCPAARIIAADLRADQLSEAAERAPHGRKNDMRFLAKQARTHAIAVWTEIEKAAKRGAGR
jgi:hypothetical protein